MGLCCLIHKLHGRKELSVFPGKKKIVTKQEQCLKSWLEPFHKPDLPTFVL
jgi:hypothetical protein